MIKCYIPQIRYLRLACAFTLGAFAAAQEVPTVLQVDIENWVAYIADVTDPSKLATSQTALTYTPPANFASWLHLADITAVNGSPAKGVMVMHSFGLALTPSPQPGQAISDVTRNGAAEFRWEFLRPDGTQIGNIYAMALSGGSPSPGSGRGAVSGSGAIVGGSGAFAGVRGTSNSISSSFRATSQAEDPSMRRILGGGKARFVFQVYPLVRPDVLLDKDGVPTVFHADFSHVSVDKPATAGETLILYAKGLGPTVPAVSPGDPFPDEPLAVATSPVEVIVDGKAVPAINQVGVPGTTDTYRVDFTIPDAIAGGTVAVSVSVAWVKGGAVRIPVR